MAEDARLKRLTKNYVPAYLGPKGWLGLRLDTRRVDWEEVAGRVTESYALVAPKRLVERV